MIPQNLKPPTTWRIRPLKPCVVITKVLSILLQERFLENVCVPRNHGYPRLLLLLLISAGKLSEGEIKDAFASFRHLKQKCATSAPLKVLDGKLLSDGASVAARWQEHFSTLLNRPTQSPPDALVFEAKASMPDSTTDTFPPTVTEVYKAMNKIKAGKAPEYAASIQSTSNTVAVMPYAHCTK